MNFHILFEDACLRVPPAANAAPGGRNMNYVTQRSAVLLFSRRQSICVMTREGNFGLVQAETQYTFQAI
jgi:hypothetical protein